MSTVDAIHLADVAGTFSGDEWNMRHAEQATEDGYPLWARATMSAETELELLRIWRLYGDAA